MNNKSGSEREQLVDTLKLAASCNLNVFETADAILHEFKFHDLQKLCEEQRGEIEELRMVDYTQTMHINAYIKEKETLESQLAEQKGEIERLMGDISVLYGQHHKHLSQLATQTERVRILEEALEFYNEFHELNLNNYNHDDVAKLNSHCIEAFQFASQALIELKKEIGA